MHIIFSYTHNNNNSINYMTEKAYIESLRNKVSIKTWWWAYWWLDTSSEWLEWSADRFYKDGDVETHLSFCEVIALKNLYLTKYV